ncbi:MAG: twin-arginine translocase TatA/TatE family subunit [Planctomycetaceae bacterium]
MREKFHRFLPGVGGFEMMIVGIIALLGRLGKNLPSVAKNMGKSFAEFKKGISGFQDEIRNATREVEKTVTYTPPVTKSTSEARPKVAVSEHAPSGRRLHSSEV